MGEADGGTGVQQDSGLHEQAPKRTLTQIHSEMATIKAGLPDPNSIEMRMDFERLPRPVRARIQELEREKVFPDDVRDELAALSQGQEEIFHRVWDTLVTYRAGRAQIHELRAEARPLLLSTIQKEIVFLSAHIDYDAVIHDVALQAQPQINLNKMLTDIVYVNKARRDLASNELNETSDYQELTYLEDRLTRMREELAARQYLRADNAGSMTDVEESAYPQRARGLGERIATVTRGLDEAEVFELANRYNSRFDGLQFFMQLQRALVDMYRPFLGKVPLPKELLDAIEQYIQTKGLHAVASQRNLAVGERALPLAVMDVLPQLEGLAPSTEEKIRDTLRLVPQLFVKGLAVIRLEDEKPQRIRDEEAIKEYESGGEYKREFVGGRLRGEVTYFRDGMTHADGRLAEDYIAEATIHELGHQAHSLFTLAEAEEWGRIFETDVKGRSAYGAKAPHGNNYTEDFGDAFRDFFLRPGELWKRSEERFLFMRNFVMRRVEGEERQRLSKQLDRRMVKELGLTKYASAKVRKKI